LDLKHIRYVAFLDEVGLSIFPFANYKIHPISQSVFSQQIFLRVKIQLPRMKISALDVAAVIAIRCNFASE
jgi:hypothetical protein